MIIIMIMTLMKMDTYLRGKLMVACFSHLPTQCPMPPTAPACSLDLKKITSVKNKINKITSTHDVGFHYEMYGENSPSRFTISFILPLKDIRTGKYISSPRS